MTTWFTSGPNKGLTTTQVAAGVRNPTPVITTSSRGTTSSGSGTSSYSNNYEKAKDLLQRTGQSGQDNATILAIASNPNALAQLEAKASAMKSGTSYVSTGTTTPISTDKNILRTQELLKQTGQYGLSDSEVRLIASNPNAMAQLERKAVDYYNVRNETEQKVKEDLFASAFKTDIKETGALNITKDVFGNIGINSVNVPLSQKNMEVKKNESILSSRTTSNGSVYGVSGDSISNIPMETGKKSIVEKGYEKYVAPIVAFTDYQAKSIQERKTQLESSYSTAMGNLMSGKPSPTYPKEEFNPNGAYTGPPDINLNKYLAPFEYAAGSFALGALSLVAKPQALVTGPIQLVTSPIKTGKEMVTEFIKNPFYTVGQFYTGGKVIGLATETGVPIVKNIYTAAGSKYVPPESVFAESVLSGKETLPTTRSIPESLQRFNKPTPIYDIELLKQMKETPGQYTKPITSNIPEIKSPVLKDIQSANPDTPVVLTGGTARNVVTGVGRIRDIDIVTNTGKVMAENTAAKYPGKYNVVTHPKHPEIYRLRDTSTGKVVADFDPYKLAEEGLINTKTDIVQAGQYKVVSPDVMLASKATQILKEKFNKIAPTKQAENIQQLTGAKVITGEKTIVSSAGPGKYPGGEDIIVGKKAGSLIEDPGMYVTPKGEASPYFLRVSNEIAPEYSLNPLKMFTNLKGVPSVTEVAIEGVRQYPRSVIDLPGFEFLKTFQEAKAGEGTAWITKRSEIGQGNVPRQEIFDLGTKKSLGMEKGTSEIEAVIGYGEKIKYTPETTIGKIKGFEKYTTYQGRNIAIREAELVVTKPKTVSEISRGESVTKTLIEASKGEKILGKELVKERAYYERPTYKTPYPGLLSISAGRYKPESISYPKLSEVSYKPESKLSEVSYTKLSEASYTKSEISKYKPSEISYPKPGTSEYPRYKPDERYYPRGGEGSSYTPPPTERYYPRGGEGSSYTPPPPERYYPGRGSSYTPTPPTSKTPLYPGSPRYKFENTPKGLRKVRIKTFQIEGNVAKEEIYFKKEWGYYGNVPKGYTRNLNQAFGGNLKTMAGLGRRTFI